MSSFLSCLSSRFAIFVLITVTWWSRRLERHHLEHTIMSSMPASGIFVTTSTSRPTNCRYNYTALVVVLQLVGNKIEHKTKFLVCLLDMPTKQCIQAALLVIQKKFLLFINPKTDFTTATFRLKPWYVQYTSNIATETIRNRRIRLLQVLHNVVGISLYQNK